MNKDRIGHIGMGAMPRTIEIVRSIIRHEGNQVDHVSPEVWAELKTDPFCFVLTPIAFRLNGRSYTRRYEQLYLKQKKNERHQMEF